MGEFLEPDREAAFGLADGVQAQIGSLSVGQGHVEGADFGPFIKELPECGSELRTFHSVPQGAPQNRREEPHENVGLGPMLFLVEDGLA